jgi:hypothetical protein
MLLSIDKVLQLFVEGKDVEKIASLAESTTADVIRIIEEARALLMKHERNRSRKKVIIRKKKNSQEASDRSNNADENTIASVPPYLDRAELSAVPVEDTLVMNIAVVGDDQTASAAIVIHDATDHQVGKLTFILKRITEKKALFKTALRAYEIARYFKSKQVRVRTHDETFVKQMHGDISVQDPEFKSMIDEFMKTVNSSGCRFRCEAVGTLSNDKAVYLARRALPKKG